MKQDACEPVFRIGLDGFGGVVDRIDKAPVRWTHYSLPANESAPLIAGELLPETIAAALVVDNARPRTMQLSDSLLIVLRGVNGSSMAQTQDTVSVRMFVDAERIITVTPQPVAAVDDVQQRLRRGAGPTRVSAVLVDIVQSLVERIHAAIEELEGTADELSDRLATDPLPVLQRALADLRHRVTRLRRDMAPQRDALLQLGRTVTPILNDADLACLQEAANRQTRYVEDLASLRDLAHVTQDELNATTNYQLNRNIYVLSIVAAIFLPLGLVTGLLGINVGGIPGSDSDSAFWLVCALLLVIVMVELWFLRQRRML